MGNKEQWAAAAYVIEQIEQAGFEAVVVGGAVRDYYLQKDMHDIDIATSATPQEMKRIFQQTVDVGIEHGTVLILDGGEPIEVTTYRTEGTYADHRRPDEVVFVRTLKDDMQRRDFTMNAMALTKNYTIIDYYNGAQDIDAKLIRAVGEPAQRFAEDALRMLRAIRFSAQLGFTIEQQTLAAIQQHAATIEKIAVERIDMELAKLFTAAYVANGIEMLVTSNLSTYLPGIWRAADWIHFKANHPDKGWAYVAYLAQTNDILTAYKCSNKTQQFVKHVMAAAEHMQSKWTAWESFSYDVEVIETAYDICCYQQQSTVLPLDVILTQKAALPIATKKELAITGHHLLKWSGDKKGPWLKDALLQALQLVVTGQLSNEEQQLKEWFLHDFNN